jgi:hypothetical protein
MRIVYATALLVGIVTGAFFQGSFLHYILLIALAFYVLAPFGAVIALGAVISLRRTNLPAWIGRAFGVWLLLATTAASSWGTGFTIHHYQIFAARRFVARAVPVLDAIRSRDGRYPTELPDALGRPPSVLRSSSFYTSDGLTFRFEYWDSAGMMDGYEFTSDSRTWAYFD